MSEIKKLDDAFDDPELLAVHRAEQEELPRMPQAPEEMIEATLDPIHGCVDKLLAPLSRAGAGSLSNLQDILFR